MYLGFDNHWYTLDETRPGNTRRATAEEVREYEYGLEHVPQEDVRDCPHFDMG